MSLTADPRDRQLPAGSGGGVSGNLRSKRAGCQIVSNGYIERLQRPENLVYFFHDVVGIACIETAVLEQRTNAYKAWVRRVTDKHGIPVLAARSGVRKEELAEPY